MARPKTGSVKTNTGKRPTLNLPDYLSGSRTFGEKYTAFENYGQGKPDFGAGSGPGEPYRRVQKTVTPQKPVAPAWGKVVNRSTSNSNQLDPRAAAIRRRLRGL